MPTPEQHARTLIDERLIASGWIIQNRDELNLGAAPGIAVREFSLSTGYADYLLFVNRRAIGAVEAKPEWMPLSGVEAQSAKYSIGLGSYPPAWRSPLPFLYESTGVETFFTNGLDPEPRGRSVFSFHRPETLLEWVRQPQTLRGRLRALPPLAKDGETKGGATKGGATPPLPAPVPIRVGDSLIAHPGMWYNMVLTNPPFGKKSSITIVNEEGEAKREAQTISWTDFWATTSNKQLNFVQHVHSILDINGRAAVVVPDNVLFEGGAGETVRRRLLQQADVHTLLRLPTGVFYAQGVKANVLFFDRRPPREAPWTETLWIYDLRTNKDFSLKQNPLTRADLDEFVACYNPANRHEQTPTWSEANPRGRWRPYRYDELMARDKVNLDIFWLRDESLEDSAALPDPDVLAREIVEDLQAALVQFGAIEDSLNGGDED